LITRLSLGLTSLLGQAFATALTRGILLGTLSGIELCFLW
jgi:hypothetical protein